MSNFLLSPTPSSNSTSAANLEGRLNGVYRKSILAPGEDLALIAKIRAGGPHSNHSLARLLEGIQPYIVMVARKYDRKGVELEDLIQEGNLGALRALDDFSSERGVKFLTYADDWIRKYMREAVVRQGSINRYGSRLPSQQYHALQRVERIFDEFSDELGTSPSAAQLSERCSITLPQAHWALEVRGRRFIALQGQGGSDEDGASLEEVLADSQAPQPAMMVAAQSERDELWNAFSKLDETERRIMTMRLGLGDDVPQASWDTVASELGIGRGQAKRVSERAMAKLTAWAERAGIDGLICDQA
jgi:RNA polymerase sigma factor (sigma-70 family)